MDEVELVEDGTVAPVDQAATEPGTARDPRGRVRRLLRRWWPVPAVVLVALIAWQVVGDARTRAEVARLRETADVIGTTVTPPLESTAWGTDATSEVLGTGWTTDDGTIAGLVRERADGPWEVVGLDLATGDERWRAVVAPATSDVEGLPPSVGCAPDATPARSLWCTVQVPVLVAPPGSTAEDAWTGLRFRSSLVEVDLATGDVGDAQGLPDSASAAVTGGRQIVVAPTAEGLDVTATEVGTTTVAWHTVLPDAIETDAGVTPSILVLDGYAAITGTATTVLDPADGAVLATDDGLPVARGAWLVASQGSSATTVLGRTDGSADADAGRSLEGIPAHVVPDDGSDPDVLLLSVADGTLLGELRAVDVPTGRTLWAQEGSAAATNLIVLDDTVYGSTGQTLWARDLATGRTVWETATDQSQTAGYLLTDGSALLRSETDRRAGEAVLAAYGLHDGEQRWTTPLPDGITSAAVVGDLLVGWGAAGPRVLG
jgi:hypothetical protein